MSFKADLVLKLFAVRFVWFDFRLEFVVFEVCGWVTGVVCGFSLENFGGCLMESVGLEVSGPVVFWRYKLWRLDAE